jgi:sugar phosphate isomerase/epimerase
MRIVSTHLFRRQRLTPTHLNRLAEAGVEAVELFCARPSFDYHDRTQMADLAAWFGANRMRAHSMHSPIYADEKEGRSGEPAINIADPDPRLRLAALDEVQRALEFSERVPFRYLIQHIGPSRIEWDLRLSDRALTSLERIRLLCKQAGVRLLVENIPNGLSQPEKLIEFLNRNHLDDVGICFDIGHAHLRSELFGGGGAAASWDILSSRVMSTHLHDNHGDTDEHLWPGDGTIDWNGMKGRFASSPDVPLVLEVGDKGEAFNPERLKRTWELIA